MSFLVIVIIWSSKKHGPVGKLKHTQETVILWPSSMGSVGGEGKKCLSCAWDRACAQEIKCQRNRRTASAFYPFYQFCTSIRSTRGMNRQVKWLLKKLQIVKTWQDKRDSSQEMVAYKKSLGTTGRDGVTWTIRTIAEIPFASQRGFAVASDKGFLPSWERGHNLKGSFTVNLRKKQTGQVSLSAPGVF